jgi:hypothetical protein
MLFISDRYHNAHDLSIYLSPLSASQSMRSRDLRRRRTPNNVWSLITSWVLQSSQYPSSAVFDLVYGVPGPPPSGAKGVALLAHSPGGRSGVLSN